MSEAPADPRVALTGGEMLAAASALLLLVLMFAAQWYGVAGVPGTSAHAQAVSTENAWSGLTVVRWVMLLAIVSAAAAVAMHAVKVSRSTVALLRLAVVGFGSLSALLLTYRVLINFPSPSDVVDQKLGAVLGVACAYGIAIGGFEAIREQRARARGMAGTSAAPVVSAARRR